VAFYSLSFTDYAGHLIQVASTEAQDYEAARAFSLQFDYFDVAELKILQGRRLVYRGPVQHAAVKDVA
jgi:hypothetical protein